MPNYYPGRFEEPAIWPGNPFASEADAVARQAEEQRLASPRTYHPEKYYRGNPQLSGGFDGLYFPAGTTEEQIRELIKRHPSYFISPEVQRSQRPASLPGQY
jgi:hypothetical protein